MIEEFLSGVVKALPGAVVSLVVSGLMLYYLRRYIDAKLAAEEQRRKEDHEIRRQRSELEQKRRRAAGRMLFWLHHAVTKPPPTGNWRRLGIRTSRWRRPRKPWTSRSSRTTRLEGGVERERLTLPPAVCRA